MKLKSIRLGSKKLRLSPLLAAFLIPFLGMIAVLIAEGCEPFGNSRAFLYSDEYHQYYPFFTEFRRTLLSGKSLLFNWDLGMGLDYLGLISYYLASPLNLLSVFVPEGLVLEYFEMLPPIKLGLASLFFALFLKKIFHKDDMSIALFGGFYGLCAWALGYQWNIMWLDTFALLPLVVLGTIYLLRDKKPVLYTLTLFLSVFANYYIGLFTCIFVFLVFVCYQICRPAGFKRLAQDLGRIALFTVLAIGMTAILELPALAALQDTYSSQSIFPNGFHLNIVDYEVYKSSNDAWLAFSEALAADAGLLSLIGKFFTALFKSFPPLLYGMAKVAGNMSGELAPTMLEGMPNIACGLGPMLLGFLFFTAKDVKLRDKLSCAFLLVFFMLSFLLRKLDFMWHGFHFPNMIPYRFSFLYSFVMLYIAYRAWLLRETFSLWKIGLVFVLGVGVVFCSEKADDLIFLAYNLAFLLLYLIMFVFSIADKMLCRGLDPEEDADYIRKRARRTSRIKTVSLCIFMCLELGLTLVKFSLALNATTITDYPTGTANAESAFNYIEQREANSEFYRIETTHAQILNDSALNDYSGISLFASSADVRTTEFLEAMGQAAYPPFNRYCYEISSPVTDLFTNMKYMVARDGEPPVNPYYNTLHNFGDVYLLENKTYLPLGFLAEPSLSEATLERLMTDSDGETEYNEFEKQNTIFSLATGLEEDVWTMVHGITSSVSATGITITDPIKNHEATYVTYHSGSEGGTLRISYKIESAGFLCFEMNITKKNSYTLYLNQQEMFKESISVPQIVAVSTVQPGDTVDIEITCATDVSAEDPSVVNVRAAMLNDSVFQQGYEILSASKLDLTTFSEELVEGTINCNRDGLMYTSIPYNGNWYAEVDGKEVPIVLVGDAMIGLELTEGVHTVTFRYKNNSFTLGAIVSGICLLAFLCIIFVPPYIQKRKKAVPQQ